MLRFRILVLVLICWLSAVFLIQRIVGTNVPTITIQPFVNALILAIPVAAMIYRPLMTLPLRICLLSVLGLYAIGKVINAQTAADPITVLAFATLELSIIVVTTWLSWHLVRWFHTYDESIKDSIHNPIKIWVKETYREPALIEERIAAARRFGRQLTLLHIRFNNPSRFTRGSSWSRVYDARDITFQLRLAELLRFLTGSAAIISWYQNDLVICLPNINRTEDIRKLSGDIQEVMKAVLKLDVTVGVASFPKDGLMLSDLVSEASKTVLEPTQALTELKQVTA